MHDRLQLRVEDVELDVLTGIYSEETNQPQPLRVTVTVDFAAEPFFTPESDLSHSMNYLDVKDAVLETARIGKHFKLVEAVADFIIARVMAADTRVHRVKVRIDKLAISENGELIGITLERGR